MALQGFGVMRGSTRMFGLSAQEEVGNLQTTSMDFVVMSRKIARVMPAATTLFVVTHVSVCSQIIRCRISVDSPYGQSNNTVKRPHLSLWQLHSAQHGSRDCNRDNVSKYTQCTSGWDDSGR